MSAWNEISKYIQCFKNWICFILDSILTSRFYQLLVSSEKISVWYIWRLSSIEPDNRNQNHAHCVLKKCSRHHHQYSLAFQKFNLSCLSKKWPVFWPFLSIKSRIASRRYMSCFTCLLLLLLLANNRISNFVIKCNLLIVIYKYKHNWRYCTRNSVLQTCSSMDDKICQKHYLYFFDDKIENSTWPQVSISRFLAVIFSL